jgi:hypothetical protein
MDEGCWMRWNVRRARREATELLGRIHGFGGEGVKVGVRKLSATGAALRTDVPLPAEFDLEIPQINKTFRAALRWKDQHTAGVHFVAEA